MTMNTGETAARMRFSGHETFPFRYGWLKKGVDAVRADPSVFLREDALVRLGVGKNMVRAIRHWCSATGLVAEQPDPANSRARLLHPTMLGDALLRDGGWDPYLEDPASLALLHWQLIRTPVWATTWHLGFLAFREREFTKRDLAQFILRRVGEAGSSVAEGLLDRDIDVFTRTYAPSRNATALREDTMDCPLVELNLLAETGAQACRFIVGPKPSLPAAVFGYTLFDFHATHHAGRATLGIGECVYDAGSPGQGFKLDENSVVAYVEELALLTEGAIGMDETAGIAQVYFHRRFDPFVLLRQYYAVDATGSEAA